MATLRKSPLEITIEDLDRELIARGASNHVKKQFVFKDTDGIPARDDMIEDAKELYKNPPPINKTLADLSTWDLVKVIIHKTRSIMDYSRTGIGYDDLMDWYELGDKQIKGNADCVAAVTLKDNLKEDKNGFFSLIVKKYEKTFNLCILEPFREQPVSAGLMFGGFLVKDDIIATSGHTIDENNVRDLRFVFGFKMSDGFTAVTRFSNEDIYNGVEIIRRSSHPEKGNWVLVKLDRKVVGQSIAQLSEEPISLEQEIYTVGHPLGLPLKYAPGLFVGDISHEGYFGAELSVYSGGCGSPVFDVNSHKVVGLIDRDVYDDFRWTGDCWVTVIYPEGKNHLCTRVSAFSDLIRQL